MCGSNMAMLGFMCHYVTIIIIIIRLLIMTTSILSSATESMRSVGGKEGVR